MIYHMYYQICKWQRCSLVFLFLLLAGFANAQSKSFELRGVVLDSVGHLPISNVTVAFVGKSAAVSTDAQGQFLIKDVHLNDQLVLTSVGFDRKTVQVTSTNRMTIFLSSSSSNLDEVTVVAYGTQKKTSMVASITSINPKEIKGPTSNLTTMLAGRVAGLIAYQRSGEPGNDNASFFIRGVGTFGAGKKDPLILIDGMESNTTALARLQPDDIAGFSVLKDAAASALYGARGANGVVLVNTKSGIVGKAKFNARFENSISTNTRNFQFADNITYMNLANEAVLTRNPRGTLPYDQNKIDHTARGDDPLLYPNNNWIDQLIKDYTNNQRFNFNVTGGGNLAQYYVAGTFNNDRGILKSESGNNFDNNINLKNYSIRSNITLNITPTTIGIIRTSAQFDDYKGPIGGYDDWGNLINGGQRVFKEAIWSNPVMFPAVYPASYAPFTTHPLFGNNFIPMTKTLYNNPYAKMVNGFQEYNSSTVNVQLELKQNFDFITKGLSARLMAYTQRYSYFSVRRSFEPFYYNLLKIPGTNNTVLSLLNENQGTEYLDYSQGDRIQNTTTYGEFAVNYNRTIGKDHDITGMLIGIMRNYQTANGGNLQASLPARNIGVSGRATYAYKNKYLFEANFGYNGSERFSKDKRFGFFPSFGVGWNLQEEPMFEFITPVVSRLKLRATYGLVGNDQIGNERDRFFYLSQVNPNDPGKGFSWGNLWDYTRPGYSISRYANPNITWERAKTFDAGFDLNLKNGLGVVFDYYNSKRSDILMVRSTIPTTSGFQADIQSNMGKAESKGFDLALDYNKSFANTWWTQLRGNMTYATNRLLTNEEPNYPANLSYLTHLGYPLKQQYGLIAERLFVDDIEADNSPLQNFGGALKTMGGDIKYRDINGDGKITDLDKVPIGFPTDPEIIYGMGFTVGFKGFDVSAFLQGSARSSFFINPGNITPFAINGPYQNGLLKQVADSHWSEDNQDIRAFWPRLTDGFNNNNNQFSTWWMRNGAFLRLKSVELGYTVPKKILDRWKMSNIRIYTNALNLAVWSKFKMWDPEMGGDGLGYPVQAVYNIGINVGL
ncbi:MULTISPECIES: SusC/RagA family TonB-linked outer membrane protein [Sphingobacterium]|uniref:SusC/RagA family TonB-linked outer membrane protein n=1 Tax=Sphingobacterium TaxID=28453 RepID=UPI00257FA5A0|nr:MULTISPECIES: TonB-dependent receptor [Sphingobacterium]